MKLFIILTVTALCNAAKLERTYLPPNAQTSGGSDSILQTPLSRQPLQNQEARNIPLNNLSRNQQTEVSGFGPVDQNNVYSGINGIQTAQYQTGLNNLGYEAKPERAQAAFERNAAILRQSNENDGERYSYAYETENGIYAEENGVATNGVEAEGGFTYTGDDGKVYSIRYTADQNGFVPQGEHLPTPPPVPEEILKALEQNARDEAAGIYDDGSYNEAKYANEEARGYDFNANNQYSNANNRINTDAIIINSAIPSGSSNNIVTPVANNVAPGFGRTPAFGNSAPALNNAASNFRKPSQTYESSVVNSFGTNTISSGNNSPSFSSNAGAEQKSSVANTPSFNRPAVPAPTFGSPAASPVYGPPAASGASSTGFSRIAATVENNPSTFGQRTFGGSATSGSTRADLQQSYLPPFQRPINQNGFGRSQSFNEKDGYQY